MNEKDIVERETKLRERNKKKEKDKRWEETYIRDKEEVKRRRVREIVEREKERKHPYQ